MWQHGILYSQNAFYIHYFTHGRGNEVGKKTLGNKSWEKQVGKKKLGKKVGKKKLGKKSWEKKVGKKKLGKKVFYFN